MEPLKELTVVVPVYGEAEVFQRHAQAHQDLWNLAAQVIWVATPSNDSAHELARKLAVGESRYYFEVPPGLYAAWNLGVSQARQPWIYFNTVGDVVDLHALREGLVVAEDAAADLVFSPPKSNPANRNHLRRWPIFLEAGALRRRAGRPIDPSWLTDFQMRHHDSCVLGSLAGAVFRTAFLQPRPFPENFRSAGDVAWVYTHVAKMKAVFFPKPVAGFRVHDSSRGSPNPRDLGRLLKLLEQAVSPENRVATQKRRAYLARRHLLDLRRGSRPRLFWFLSSSIFGLRLRRDLAFHRMRRFFREKIPNLS
jgi:glycosyltransferase involved in cell wall biosynthesis